MQSRSPIIVILNHGWITNNPTQWSRIIPHITTNDSKKGAITVVWDKTDEHTREMLNEHFSPIAEHLTTDIRNWRSMIGTSRVTIVMLPRNLLVTLLEQREFSQWVTPNAMGIIINNIWRTIDSI